MIKKTMLAFCFVSTVGLAAVDIAASNPKVSFLAVGNPGLLKIRGTLTGDKSVKGVLEEKQGQLAGTISVQLGAFDTGISLRNQHMKENYLHVSKHPEATLKLEPVSIQQQSPNVEWSGPFKAKLSLHGVEKDIEGTGKFSKTDGKWSGQLNFGFDLSTFSIDVPSYLGITVSKSVQVEASFRQ